MSGDPEQEYFADGIVEDIITALSQFQSLFATLVRYVLEGTCERANTECGSQDSLSTERPACIFGPSVSTVRSGRFRDAGQGDGRRGEGPPAVLPRPWPLMRWASAQ